MKSSVRILAIALALAFLLLARTAYQDTPASAADIDLDDGEAAFMDLSDKDPSDGVAEANYVGLESGTTSTVEFYVKLDALGTQIMARTIGKTGSDHVNQQADNEIVQLRGGDTPPGLVPDLGDDAPGAEVGTSTEYIGSVIQAIDMVYCDTSTSTVSITADRVGADDQVHRFEMPEDWALSPTTDGDSITEDSPTACDSLQTVVANRLASPATTTGMYRADEAKKIRDDIVGDELAWSLEQNHKLYTYKDGTDYVDYTKINVNRLYTDGNKLTPAIAVDPAIRDTVGGDKKPLASVALRQSDWADATDDDDTTDTNTLMYADPTTTDYLTFVTDADGGGTGAAAHGAAFRAFSLGAALGATGDPTPVDPTNPNAARDAYDQFRVDITYDIVDVYEAEDKTEPGDDHPRYTSGFGRAIVFGGSDATGQFIELKEVADVGSMATSSKTNMFRGEVMITNDPGANLDMYVYVQAGDTLTLNVLSEDGDRDSSVLATASVIVDNAVPTISDRSPADKAVINDATLSIGFKINDTGAGLAVGDDVDDNVTSIELRRVNTASDGATSTATCVLVGMDSLGTIGDISFPNRSKNQVSASLAPTGDKFTECPSNVVDTESLGRNSHGKPFDIQITLKDLAGNSKAYTQTLTIDMKKPTIQDMADRGGAKDPSRLDGVLAGKGWDSDKNEPANSQNSILIKFDESLDPDSVTASDVTVTGYSVESVEVVGVNEDDDDGDPVKSESNEYILVTLTEDLAKGAKPSVSVGSVSDVAGNSLAATDKITRTAKNVIAPKVTVTPFASLLGEKGEQAISFTTDEALRSASGDTKTEASVTGPVTKKLALKVSADTMGGSGTFKEATYGKSGAYGVMVRAVDVDGNPSAAGSVKVTDEDVSDQIKDTLVDADIMVKPDNWPLADKDFDGELEDQITLTVGGAKLTAKSVNDETGNVSFTATAAVSEGTSATITYDYVKADQVIQVDVTKPKLASSVPENGKSTDYAGTIVSFTWSDDDYYGDTYKTVSVSSVMHKGPDGESMDITDMLRTNDDKRWVYAPESDLALGEHEFTMTATDAVGNTAKDVKVSFTVIERKLAKINLSPGWNLISLRGMPASADVNDVFSSDTVSVVSQYDGRRVSPWTVWTRGSDGSLSSSPAGRTTIDSSLGLWVLSSDGSALEVDIPGTSRDNPAQVPPSIELIVGWNLVAVILISVDEVGVNEYLPEGVWTRAFLLDNDTGQFKVFSPLARPTTGDNAGQLLAGEPLKAGQALWVYATKAGVIVPK